MMDSASILICLVLGAFLGAGSALFFAFAFSPLWFLAAVLALCGIAGWRLHGRTRPGHPSWSVVHEVLHQCYGPPVTREGKVAILGAVSGFSAGIWVFCDMIWGL